MVPLGRNKAASLPSRSATRAVNALTLGSSPSCSSPTGACAMACRIAWQGRVEVSLTRSTRRAGIAPETGESGETTGDGVDGMDEGSSTENQDSLKSEKAKDVKYVKHMAGSKVR